MNGKRIVAAVAGALVAGLVLGSVVSGYAATTKSTSPTSSTVAAACVGAGLRLGAAMHDGGGRLLDIVAKLTGKSTADVVAERQSGKTLAQIAAEKNVGSSTVVADALKVRQTPLAEKVADGTITQAQADSALAYMKAQLTERVNSANASCNGAAGGAGGRGCGMGGGRGAGRGGAFSATAQ